MPRRRRPRAQSAALATREAQLAGWHCRGCAAPLAARGPCFRCQLARAQPLPRCRGCGGRLLEHDPGEWRCGWCGRGPTPPVVAPAEQSA